MVHSCLKQQCKNMSSLPVDSYNRVKQTVNVSYKRLKKSHLCMVIMYYHAKSNFHIVLKRSKDSVLLPVNSNALLKLVVFYRSFVLDSLQGCFASSLFRLFYNIAGFSLKKTHYFLMTILLHIYTGEYGTQLFEIILQKHMFVTV